MSITETFHGYIETTQDSLLVFEACRRNILPKISRRLQERERKLVRSGSVFVFDEKDSGIRRWTDGLIWSPSRILGNFLIYRELDKKPCTQKQQQQQQQQQRKRLLKTTDNEGRIRQRSNSNNSTNTATAEGGTTTTFDQNTFQRNRERQIVGSLSESFNFKQNGLIKKTMSLVVQGAPLHLVSYYHPDDVLECQLRTPSIVPELANLEISPGLLSRQNFRIPPMIEPDQQQQQSFDNNNNTRQYSSFNSKLFGNNNNNNNNNSVYTLPTPTQSTPNTPLPTSPLSHYHSISTPMKSRISSNLINVHNSNNNNNSLSSSFMDYYNNSSNNNDSSSIIHSLLVTPPKESQQIHLSPYHHNNSIHILSIIQEEPNNTIENNNGG